MRRAPVGVVDGDDRDPVVVIEVAGRDELTVATALRPREVRRIDDVDETWRAATVLDVRPAVFAGGRDVDAVAVREELDLVGPEARRRR